MATLPPIRQVPSPNWNERNGVTVDLVVVHRPVGSYLGSINVLCEQRGQDSVSAHGILGRPKPGASLEFAQLVAWSKRAWACADYNSCSDNLEIADAAWDGTDPEAWKVAARIVAFRLKKRGLKPKWQRNGQGGGFCRHYDLGKAGGGHTDPTTSTLRWLRFVARVKWEFLRGGFRDTWGVDNPVQPPTAPAAAKKPKAEPLKPKPAPKKAPAKKTAAPKRKPQTGTSDKAA